MGISVLNEQLYEAVRKGDVQGVRYALAQGADANGDDRKNKPRLDGTPLMAACSNKESFSATVAYRSGRFRFLLVKRSECCIKGTQERNADRPVPSSGQDDGKGPVRRS